jgi:hypothetical protein
MLSRRTEFEKTRTLVSAQLGTYALLLFSTGLERHSLSILDKSNHLPQLSGSLTGQPRSAVMTHSAASILL